MQIRGNTRTRDCPASPAGVTLARRPWQWHPENSRKAPPGPDFGARGAFLRLPGDHRPAVLRAGPPVNLPAGDSRSGWRAAAALPHSFAGTRSRGGGAHAGGRTRGATTPTTRPVDRPVSRAVDTSGFRFRMSQRRGRCVALWAVWGRSAGGRAHERPAAWDVVAAVVEDIPLGSLGRRRDLAQCPTQHRDVGQIRLPVRADAHRTGQAVSQARTDVGVEL